LIQPGPERSAEPGQPEAGPENRRQLPSADSALVEGVRRQEPVALGRFFDLYFDRIYGLAYRLLGSRALAEDAAQEVCYRIQRGAHRLDPARDPAPWVLAVAMNTCRSIRRSSQTRWWRRTRSLESTTGEPVALVDPALGPEERLLAQERERQVQEALVRLDQRLAEVVILHDYQGLDHKEIAQALDLSHEAVRKRYSRALAALARLLSGEKA